MIDYTTFERAAGHNWYDLDPELQRFVRAGCAPEDLAATARALGNLVLGLERDLRAAVGAGKGPGSGRGADLVDIASGAN